MSQTPPPYGDQPPPEGNPYSQPPTEPATYGQPSDQSPPQPYGQPAYGQPAYGQPAYGQPAYGQPASGQPASGQSAYGQPGYATGYLPPNHQQSTTVLVLGILSLVLCAVLGPIAWVMGNRVVKEIDASNGAIGGRSGAQAGRICGIIGTVLLALSVLFVVLIFGLAIASTSNT